MMLIYGEVHSQELLNESSAQLVDTIQTINNDADNDENEEESEEGSDTLLATKLYPLKDSKGDFLELYKTNSFDDRNKNNRYINKILSYNPKFQNFKESEKVGLSTDIYNSVSSKDALYPYLYRKDINDYFKKKSQLNLFLNQRGGIPRFVASDYVFNNVFGVNKILNTVKALSGGIIKAVKTGSKTLFQADLDTTAINLKVDSNTTKKILDTIKKTLSPSKILAELDSSKYASINPKGFVDFIMGWETNTTNNPATPFNLRSNTTPLFDLKYDAKLNSQIGSKLSLPIGLSNLSNFDLRNPLYIVGGSSAATIAGIASTATGGSSYWQNLLKNIKIKYEGERDQIIQELELGVTSFSSNSTIIPSTKDLFGIKAQIKVGNLRITGVTAYQSSKLKVISLEDGSLNKKVQIKASDYEENRNFLLAHYFRKNFNANLKTIPLVQSSAQILRVEVWVTNRNATTIDTREVIAFTDLGECGTDLINVNNVCSGNLDAYPDNQKNDLYNKLKSNIGLRSSQSAISTLNSLGYVEGRDFEKIYAKKLSTNAVYFHPTLGVIMLNEQITSESVVAVSYEYMVNGQTYKVGEFSEDIGLTDNSLTKILFTKLLKNITPQPASPVWKLMMRNIYSLGVAPILKNGFNLSVLYDEPSKGQKIYLPYVDPQYRKTLVSLLGSDRLNLNNDFMADGIFDFVENVTIFPDKGKLMFPLLEPFGKDLEYTFSSPAMAQKYLFYSLYDSIHSYAATQIFNDRFIINGNIKSSTSTQISLGVFNITPNSVRVSQSGKFLQEGVDFTVDYTTGSLTIINQSIKDAKLPLTVQFEDNNTPSFQQKTFFGVRTEYDFTKNLTIGGTYTSLKEIPFNSKVLYGQEAISNQLYGFDINYKIKSRAISYFLDKILPVYVTKEVSEVKSFFELVKYDPGLNPLRQNTGGDISGIYLDDFESNFSNIALAFAPLVNWNLSSIPKNATDKTGNILFPEALNTNNLNSTVNRAHLAWYSLDQNMQNPAVIDNPARFSNLSNPKWRLIPTTELFPTISNTAFNTYTNSFDLAFFPRERGQYNFETSTQELNANGEFIFPEKKMGGITFGFQDQANFEDKNIQYIQFWMQDPFVGSNSPNEGDIYFHLGNISEDILNDNLRSYENGLPTPSFTSAIDQSVFGDIPRNPTPVTNNFINIADERIVQDVGLDGLNDDRERTNFANTYLNLLQNNFGATAPIYTQSNADPSNDNFVSVRDTKFGNSATLLERYKYINKTQGNSQVTNDVAITLAATNIPDKEDINNDNILNTTEDYFQYNLHIENNMQVGNNFIVDKKIIQANMQLDGQTSPSQQSVTWYLVRIPLSDYYAKVGNIIDFKRIRFMRMVLTNFKEDVVLRLVKFGMYANTWRKNNFNLDHTGIYQVDHSNLENVVVSSVNIEENDARKPVPYILPPGITRVQQTVSTGSIALQNEQSLGLRVKDLKPNETKGIFKNVNLNLNNYGKIKMFIHAESFENEMPVNDDEMEAVIRLATDFTGNYYEISIPLKVTPLNKVYTYYEEIWPIPNNLDFDLQILKELKVQRNKTQQNYNTLYSKKIDGRTYSIYGSPSLAQIKGIVIAVRNKSPVNNRSIEIWADELRLSDLNQQSAYAGHGNINMKLADLGTLNVTGSFHTAGFGSLEQKINERNRDNYKEYSVTARLDLSKMLPDNIKMSIPFYMNIGEELSTPQYDQYDSDLTLEEKLSMFNSTKSQDSFIHQVIDYTKSQTYSLTNVHVMKKSNELIPFYSIKNWNFSYTYSSIYKHNPLIELYDFSNHNGTIIYSYNPFVDFIEPFKLWASKSKWLKPIKALNINFIPSKLVFKTILDRQFTITKSRSLFEDDNFKLPEYYNKNFNIIRTYETQLKITKSLILDYKAINQSRVDEPEGRIDNGNKRKILFAQLLKGGRNINFAQDMELKYELPTNLISILDWTKVQLKYAVKFVWQTAPDSFFYLGHTIQNMNRQDLGVDLNMIALYNKAKLTKAMTNKFLSPLFLIKRIKFIFADVYQSTINGFLFTPQMMGLKLSNAAPGFDYIVGMQPSKPWLDDIASKEWLTHSNKLNQNFLQSMVRTVNMNVELKPFPNLDITLDFQYTFGNNYTELFKDTSERGDYEHLNAFYTGRFNISYWAFQTLFENFKSPEIHPTLQNFLDNRIILSERLGKKANTTAEVNGYYKGYDQYAQDVLIPSFISAYTRNSNAGNVSLINHKSGNISDNPFLSYLPLPNWKITYNGLKELPFIKKYFSSFRLTNNYSGMMSVNEIAINPRYREFEIGIPVFIDENSKNLVPYYRIPNITITDKFEPLIGVDLITRNKISIGFLYSKQRTASISLVDFQLSENYKEQFGYAFGYRIPFAKKLAKKNFKPEIAFKCDLLYSQDFNYNFKLNQSSRTPTGGNTLLNILPSVEFLMIKNLIFKVFYEVRSNTNNLTQLSTTVYRGGLLIRYILD